MMLQPQILEDITAIFKSTHLLSSSKPALQGNQMAKMSIEINGNVRSLVGDCMQINNWKECGRGIQLQLTEYMN